MADTDFRRGYANGDSYRGAGGDRGFKRKRRDEDDFDQGQRRQRRRENAPPPGTRIRHGLLEIGEDVAANMAPRPARGVAEMVSKLAAENWDDDFVKDTFCTVATKLAVEQPLKIPYLAATVLFANAEKGTVGATFLERLVPLVQSAVDSGEWRDLKLLLRLLACLGPMFAQDGILVVLDELFNRAVDLQTESQDDVVGIEIVKIILLTIPYLVAFSSDVTVQQRVGELLEKTDIVASSPHSLQALVDPYPSDGTEAKAMPCTSLITLLQKQLLEESANNWKLRCIPKIFDRHREKDNDDSGASAGTFEKHAMPTIEVPAVVTPGPNTLFPEIFFSLFADQDIESAPPTSDLASVLIRDVVADTLNILDYNRNVAAKLLSELDNYWPSGLFARRGTAFDKLKATHGDGPSWKPEDVAVDAIFSQMLRLPAAEHKIVYYHATLTELCKISPQAIAPSLGRAIRWLYRNIDTMDLELAYRFLDWFAHHLSNFEFRWKWSEWIPELDHSLIHPKKAFIVGAVDKEIRLSFAKRIRETLPDAFQDLVPASKEKDIPDFKYASDSTPYAAQGQKILSLLKSKAPEADIQLVLDDVQAQASEHGSDPLVACADIYMTAICSIGAKSLSHVLSTIDRCNSRLLQFGQESEAARRQIISSVVDFWHDHPGNAVNIVDKLLNYSVITPLSVAEWALRDRMDRGRALASPQIYELISTTISKVTERLRQIVQQRNDPGVPIEQRRQIDELLPRERRNMADLFELIDDAVQGVATGAQDEMIERYDGNNDEQDLIMTWGRRWTRVWRRKAAVEETVVGEAAMKPIIDASEEDADRDAAQRAMDTVDEDI